MSRYDLGIRDYVSDGSNGDCRQVLSNFGYDTTYVFDICDKAYDAKERIRKILSLHPNWDEKYQSIIFSGDYHKGIESYQSNPFLSWVYSKLSDKYKTEEKPHITSLDWTKEENMLYGKLSGLLNSGESLVTPEMIEDLGEYAEQTKINVGLKTTKAVQRICKILNVTDIVEIKPVTHNNITTNKNFGWNYQYALLCDALTPQTISRWTVISIHPLAYWTMSFGHKWASCHTIDIDGDRGYEMNGSHTYEGCYSSGTESYMLDDSTVIFYTVDPEYSRDQLLLAPKMQRCNFHISETGEIMVQGRVYPDGRDGGDNSLAGQYRQTMQKVLSECLAFNNLWTLRRGTDACHEHTYTNPGSTHYKDYINYDDCSVSILKEIKEESPKMVFIGHKPICPACGEEHSRENNIECEYCRNDDNIEECYGCGRRINTEIDTYYTSDDGYIFCCISCANDNGYYQPEDKEYGDYDTYNKYNLYYERSTDTWWYYDDDAVDIDGNWYHNREAAEDDGWEYYEATDRFYQESDFEEDAQTGERFPYWSNMAEYYEHDRKYFMTEENMEEWIAENEKEEVA